MSYVSKISKKLEENGYCSNAEINCALEMAECLQKPLLIEGVPGVGKTALPVAIAKAKGIPLIRLQMYEGLTDDKILYDYDYQKQLLTLEAIKPVLEKELKDKDIKDAVQFMSQQTEFYGPDFLIHRPILRSITEGPCVLLIDEIDKANEAMEYLLYEFLENYTITIPQFGPVVCPVDKRPMVFITSNNYRPLSTALKRRCIYLYMNQKTESELIDILRVRSKTDQKTAEGIARCLLAAQKSGDFRQVPSVSEGIDWAEALMSNPERTQEFVQNTLCVLIKDRRDHDQMLDILLKEGKGLWE